MFDGVSVGLQGCGLGLEASGFVNIPVVGRAFSVVGPKIWNRLLGKVLPYSLPSVGPGADPDVQAVSPQVTFYVIPVVGCH